jgi:ribosomal protein L12E/L44/L45/RPP1/RPP2
VVVALLLMIFNPQVRASTIGVLLQPLQGARPERAVEQEVRAKPRAAAYGKLGKDEEQAPVRDEDEDEEKEEEEEVEEEEAVAAPTRPKKSRARKGSDASRPTRQSAPAPIAPTQPAADDAPVSGGDDATANGGAASLAPGQRVRVHGLKAAPQHNGKTGIVIEQTESGDGAVRWNVCLAGGEKLALRETNIEQLGAGIDAMVAALEQAGEHEKAALLRASLSK